MLRRRWNGQFSLASRCVGHVLFLVPGMFELVEGGQGSTELMARGVVKGLWRRREEEISRLRVTKGEIELLMQKVGIGTER